MTVELNLRCYLYNCKLIYFWLISSIVIGIQKEDRSWAVKISPCHLTQSRSFPSLPRYSSVTDFMEYLLFIYYFHIYFSKYWNIFFVTLAACARQPLGPSVPTPVAMNHLLLGKSALLSVRGRRGGPPPGAVPPPASITLKSAPKQQRGRQQQRITPQGTRHSISYFV